MEAHLPDQPRQGGCLCGAVRFEITGPVLYSCICHCQSCRKASGGAYVPWATFEKARLSLLAGDMQWFRSSPGVTRGHCPGCGTTLTYEDEDRTGQIDITVSSFDDPTQFAPVAHIWVEDKLPWVCIDDELPRYAKTADATAI